MSRKSTFRPVNRVIFLVPFILIILGLFVACGPVTPMEADTDFVPVDSEELVLVDRDNDTDTDSNKDENVDVEADEVDRDDSSNEQLEIATIPPTVGPTVADELYNGVPVGFTESGHAYMGNPDAEIVIEEYSDYQCPFCQRFYTGAMANLKSAELLDGTAQLIFYDFPLISIHPQAVAAANATRCAGEFGAAAYWAMHDALFVNLGKWGVPNPVPMFTEYAAQITGVDVDAFTTCATENRYQDEINIDLKTGQARGISGTPGFFINDELLSGAQPYERFVQSFNFIKEGKSIDAPAPVEAPKPIELGPDVAFSMGDPDAKVKIVEYTDLQCPYCAKYTAETFPLILENYINTGRVYYEFRDLPLDQIHPLAREAAVANRCAGEQDAYVAMHDLIFVNQAMWQSTAVTEVDAIFASYGAELGLDAAAFDECLASDRYDAEIEVHLQEALEHQLRSTPFFVVDGYPVLKGAQPYENFEYVIKLVEEGGLVDAITDSIERGQEQERAAATREAAPPTAVPNVGDIPEEGAFSIGDPNAPVTIVEYTDYQCGFCRRHASETFPSIQANYIDQGLVRYVFKDFPLTSIHPQADEAAVAVRCANEQDQFLEMHLALFSNSGRWSVQEPYAELTVVASELGMDTEAFTECVNRGEYEAEIQADLDEGASYGVRGTPAFFINGEFVNGAQPYTVFSALIDQFLAE